MAHPGEKSPKGAEQGKIESIQYLESSIVCLCLLFFPFTVHCSQNKKASPVRERLFL